MSMHCSAFLGYGVMVGEGQYDQLPWEVVEGSDKPEAYQWLSETTGRSPYSRRSDSAPYDGPIIQCIVVNNADDSPLNVMVVIGSSINNADYGKPILPITAIGEDEIAAAQKFCAEHGIPFEDPHWLLFADIC